MAQQCSPEDFLSRYRLLCSQRKVASSKMLPKFVRRSELRCPVECVASWHWPLLLRALSTDRSLARVEFHCNLSPTSQKQTSQKLQKIMDKYYPIPYGCTAFNISNICQAVATMLVHSEKAVDVRLENLHLAKDDVLILADSLSCSKVQQLSFAESLIEDESLELLCRKLYHSKIPWLNFSSCQITGERLKSICRLLKYNKNNRTRDMYFLGLRNQTPVLDEMEGISRVTLSNNALGDEGVEIIMKSLEDDLWLKVLDLQKCEIGNEGAECILETLKNNVTFQDIDLRQNDIDTSILEQISLQLSLNNAGKDLTFRREPLWRPRHYTVRNPRRIVRMKKAVKMSPPKLKPLPKKPSSMVGFQFSLPSGGGGKDVSVQTEELDEEVKRIHRTLANEIKLRECLMHLLKKYKMENCTLRQEVNRLTRLDDHILIDQETFAEVKATFDKFKRFLAVMKEYGLFECIAMLGVNENTDIVLRPLILNATKKCMQLVENEPPTDPLDPPSDPSWPPSDDLGAALAQNGFSHKMEYDQDLTLAKDKALVQRVYREVRESYSRPSFPPKRPPEAPPLRKRPKDGRLEAVSKIRQLRSPKEVGSASDPEARPKLKGTVKRSRPSDLVATVRTSLEDFGLSESVRSSPDGAKSATGTSTRSEARSAGTSSRSEGKSAVTSSHSEGKSAETLSHLEGKSGVTSSHSEGKSTVTSSRSEARSAVTSSRSEAKTVGPPSHSVGKSAVTSSRSEAKTVGPPSHSEAKYSSLSGPSKGSLAEESVASEVSSSSFVLTSGSERKDSGSYLESVSDAASTDRDVKSLADSEVYSAPPSVDKGLQNPSVVSGKVSQNPSVVSRKVSQNPSVATTKGSQNPSMVSTKVSQNPSVASAIGSQNPSMASAIGSQNPSVVSTKGSQNLRAGSAKESRNPSVATTKGSQNPSAVSAKASQNPSVAATKGLQNPGTVSAKGLQNPSAPSAKESQNPSVATTKGSQNPTKGSQNHSVVPANRSEPDEVASTDNGSEGSLSKSSKRRRAKKSAEENLKKVSSDSSSVPSLSDITTVSSRSLNTDSVLGQLSQEEA